MRAADITAAEVVVVGSFNQDHVWRSAQFPRPGETRHGVFSTGPGGKGFNQAVASARQGVATAFVAAIGRDALGDAAVVLAQNEALRARWLRLGNVATGSAAILLNDAGENLIVVGAGANGLLHAGHVARQLPLIRSARVVLTQQETTVEACVEAMTLARQHGVLTLHNPAPAGEPAISDALLALTDVLTPNESEFAALLAQRGVTVGSDLNAIADAELRALCMKLGVPTVVITLGAAGVFVAHADPQARRDVAACYRLPAEPAKVVDTTGAGDAFNGGLAAALALEPQGAFIEAARYAVRVATLAVEREGAALAMPTRGEVSARFL